MNLRRFSFSYGKRIHPARDWSVLLLVSILMLVASIGGNLWLFEHVAGGGLLGEIPQGAPPVFSQASLDTISKIFDNRAIEENKYQNGTYRFIDPSRE